MSMYNLDDVIIVNMMSMQSFQKYLLSQTVNKADWHITIREIPNYIWFFSKNIFLWTGKIYRYLPTYPELLRKCLLRVIHMQGIFRLGEKMLYFYYVWKVDFLVVCLLIQTRQRKAVNVRPRIDYICLLISPSFVVFKMKISTYLSIFRGISSPHPCESILVYEKE